LCCPDATIEISITDKVIIPEHTVIYKDKSVVYGTTGDGYIKFDEANPTGIFSISRDMKSASVICTKEFALSGTVSGMWIFNMLSDIFRQIILVHNGFVFHSSAISYSGTGVAFAADSGTGKSTHTGLWQRAFGTDAEIINDDAPAIRIIKDIPYIFGTPWSGKTPLNNNIGVPLKAIVLLTRREKNIIGEISVKEALEGGLFTLTFLSRFPSLNAEYWDTIDRVLKKIKLYSLRCNTEESAAITAKEKIYENC